MISVVFQKKKFFCSNVSGNTVKNSDKDIANSVKFAQNLSFNWHMAKKRIQFGT